MNGSFFDCSFGHRWCYLCCPLRFTIPYVVWHGIRDMVRQMHFETEMEQERRRSELRKRTEIKTTNLRVIPGGKDN